MHVLEARSYFIFLLPLLLAVFCAPHFAGAETVEIKSTPFADQNAWYQGEVGVFSWEIPETANGLALDISTTSGAEPMTGFTPPIGMLALPPSALKEGVQYLNLQFRNTADGEWGPVTAYRIQIDRTAPEPFQIGLTEESGIRSVTFSTTDALSGIDRYEVALQKGGLIVFDANDGVSQPAYALPAGDDVVSVTAYDKAGNMRTETAILTKEANTETEPTFLGFMFKEKEGTLFFGFLAAFLLLLPLVFMLYMLTEREHHKAREMALRREVVDIEREMQKIFTALRIEIYDQINTLTAKKRPTIKEKKAIEGLNSALRVSETLLQKEVTDVKRVLRAKQK